MNHVVVEVRLERLEVWPCPSAEELVFDVAEDLLGGAVVDAVALPGHALDDPGSLQQPAPAGMLVLPAHIRVQHGPRALRHPLQQPVEQVRLLLVRVACLLPAHGQQRLSSDRAVYLLPFFHSLARNAKGLGGRYAPVAPLEELGRPPPRLDIVLHPKIGAHKKSLPFLDVQEMGGSSHRPLLIFLDGTYRAGTRSTLLQINLCFSDSFEQSEKRISKPPKAIKLHGLICLTDLFHWTIHSHMTLFDPNGLLTHALYLVDIMGYE